MTVNDNPQAALELGDDPGFAGDQMREVVQIEAAEGAVPLERSPARTSTTDPGVDPTPPPSPPSSPQPHDPPAPDAPHDPAPPNITDPDPPGGDIQW